MATRNAANSLRFFFEALDRHDLEAAASFVGEGFSVEAPGRYPLGFKDYFKAQMALWEAFPDLRYNAGEIKQSLSLGSATIRIEGTFLHDLALPFHGLPLFQASGDHFSLPPEKLGFTLEWGEILTVRTESPTALGLLGPMFLVGATLPPPGIMG